MFVKYTASFLKQYYKLKDPLKEEIKEKIELFKEDPDHPFLKTHKLKGRLKGCFSFSVNYEYRIIFQYLPKKEAVLLAVGNHDIYK